MDTIHYYLLNLEILCNYWDDPRGLMRLLESPGLANITRTIHILDGKYIDHEGKPEYMQELTNAVYTNYNQRNWNGKIHYAHRFSLTQIEKRNLLWTYINKTDPDFTIILDSDEYVELDVDIFEDQLKGLSQSESRCFDLESYHMGTDYKLPRLFKRFSNWNFIYKGSHASLYDMNTGKEIIGDRHSQGPVLGFKIIHDKKTRSKSREELDKKYRTIPNH